MKLYTQPNITDLHKYIPPCSGIYAIIDNKVKDYFCNMKDWKKFYVSASESQKSLKTASRIYSWLLEQKADRDCLIIGAGGGVTTDLAGFVAATYKRGVRFALVPTTLLAAADASIGGKNGVNLNGVKNAVGTITQPLWVFQSTVFFKTLDERVFKEGIAEILKTFLLFSRDNYFNALTFFASYNFRTPSQRQERSLLSMINLCAELKMKVVEKDEYDRGERNLLNLGHTFGHALESFFAEKKRRKILHGEAVAAGIYAAAAISVKLGKTTEKAFSEITGGLKDTGLERRYGIEAGLLLKYIRNDKKIKGGNIRLVLPIEPGRAEIIEIPLERLEKLCTNLIL